MNAQDPKGPEHSDIVSVKPLDKELFSYALGIVLKKLMVEQGKTSKEVSIACGLEEYVISRIITGKQRFMFLEAHEICRVLGISMDFLSQECLTLMAKDDFKVRISKKKDLKSDLHQVQKELHRLIPGNTE